MTKNIRIVIADESSEVRAHVHELIECQKNMEIIAETGDGRDAILLIKKHLPDLALLDIDMPGINGLQVLKCIRKDHPHIQVVIVSRSIHRASVKEAQRLGANGYVAKRDVAEQLLLAIETVMSGASFLSNAVSRQTRVATTKVHETASPEKSGVDMTNGKHGDTSILQASQAHSKHYHATSPETGTIRVLVVDDESFVIDHIVKILNQDKQIQLVGSCESDETAIELAKQHSPNVILLDLTLWYNARGGWYVVDRLREARSDAHVILCTRTTERAVVSEALRKEIAGFVPKKNLNEELIKAVRTVYSGEQYFSPSLGKPALRIRGRLGSLSDQPREVFHLFVRGRTPKQIADELYISVNTVYSHVTNIKSTLGHKHGWEHFANKLHIEEKAHKERNAHESSSVLDDLTERQRKVFDQYVGRWEDKRECHMGGITNPENIAEALGVSVGEVKDLIQEIHYKLSRHPDGWKGIAREEGII